MDIPDDDGPEIIKEIDWSITNDSFSNKKIPSVEGHANKIDEYLKY